MAKKSSERSKKTTGKGQSPGTPAAGTAGGVTPVAGDKAAPAAPVAATAARRGKGKPGQPKAKRSRSKPARTSGLDAAADVLAAVGQPMRCGEIVDRMLAKGLWKTGGKTPAATINAAIIREIRSKGKQSRFRKTGRGLFTAAKGA